MKPTKKEQRREGHKLVARIIWQEILDGSFGERGPASDVAIRAVINHCKMGGTTFKEYLGIKDDQPTPP